MHATASCRCSCVTTSPADGGAGAGGIVEFTSGAGLAGGPNMVAYGGTKAFDMVFTEGLWAELHDKGVDVLGLILGKTDTPALRKLEFERGRLASLDEVPEGAVTAASVVDEAFANLGDGPTIATGDDTRMGLNSSSPCHATRWFG